MNNRKKFLAGLISLIFLAGLVTSQAGFPNFPNGFQISINQLPPQISANQLFFGCPYDQNINIKEITVWNIYGTPLNAVVDIEVVAQGRLCQQSVRKNISIGSVLTSNQLLSSTGINLNNFLQNQAQNNTQPPIPPSPLASGNGATP